MSEARPRKSLLTGNVYFEMGNGKEIDVTEDFNRLHTTLNGPKDARIKELEDENEKLRAIFESVRNLDQYSAQEAINEICIKFQKARLDYEQFKTKDKE